MDRNSKKISTAIPILRHFSLTELLIIIRLLQIYRSPEGFNYLYHATEKQVLVTISSVIYLQFDEGMYLLQLFILV